jgi:hypothetical protein
MEWSTPFEWEGLAGNVRVECVANDAPDEYGTLLEASYGFPVCTATVQYPRRGYRSMFGWVQLVRSTDNESRGAQFEVDPFALFADARSPYCWYGIEPTLFDSPSRSDRTPLSWLSQSFLATTPIDEVMDGNPRRVVPIVGFAWGFDLHDDDSVELREITALSSSDWEAAVPLLRAEYPGPFWTFAETL